MELRCAGLSCGMSGRVGVVQARLSWIRLGYAESGRDSLVGLTRDVVG